MRDDYAARLVDLNGTKWVIGAHWSATGILKKPANLYRFTEEQGLDPDRTLAVHIQEIGQIGWYEFEDTRNVPKSAPPLVKQLITQIDRRGDVQIKLPHTFVLNLGECVWLIIIDGNGSVLPLLDRWGTMEEIDALLGDPETAGELAPFRVHRTRLLNPNEAIEWLFSGAPVKVATATRMKASAYIVRQGLFVTVALGSIAFGAHHFWSQYQEKKQASLEAQRLALQSAKQTQMAQTQAELIKQKEQFQANLEAYWKNYPRPWVGVPRAKDEIAACINAINSQQSNQFGWQRNAATCTMSPFGINLVTSWARNALATVMQMPGSISDADDSQSTLSQSVTVPASQAQNIKPPDDPTSILQPSSVETTLWIGGGQQFSDVVKLVLNNFSEFKPNPPSFVTQNQVKQVEAETPVLWHQASVRVDSSLPPTSGWPMLNSPGLVVGTLSVTFSSDQTHWELLGVQYAK